MRKTTPKRFPRINAKAAEFCLRVGRSPLHLYGLFALEDIPAGRRVIEYTGERLDRAEAAGILPPNDSYLAGLNSRVAIDGGRGGSGAQFINHSCDPNLIWRTVRNRLLFFSRGKIRAGEELTVNYRYPIKLQRVPCHCGAARCRGTLRFILT